MVDLADRLRTEGDAYRFLEDLRWGDQPVCPHCGSVRPPYFLTPENGTSRKTRTGSKSERRVWKCADCRHQFSVLTGTVFHGTKIPIRKWIFVIFEMCSSKNGISAREIERKYGVAPKSAWHMLHRLRKAMERDPLAGLLSGRVVVDEAWVGGNPRNRHGGQKLGRGWQPTDKTPVVSLVSRETGEVRSRVVPDVTGENLRRVMDDQLEVGATHLQTDKGQHFRGITRDFASHSIVNHQEGEYVAPNGASTNPAENFFSQLKRSIDGTHHHVSREHLHRYLSEFDWRFSTRELSDTARTARLVSQAHGKRLKYRETH